MPELIGCWQPFCLTPNQRLHMEVKIEELGKLSRKAHIELPMAPIEKEVEDKLKAIAKTAKVQGFRPGKAPIKVIEKQRGAEIRQEVISYALQEAFIKAVQDNKLEIIGEPQFEPGPVAEDGKLEKIEFDVVFDVRPEIELGDLSKVKVTKPVLEITDKEIDQTLEVLRKRYPDFAPVDRASKEGDKLVIDFAGKLDGVAFDGGSANNIEMVVGAGQFLPDFEKAVYDKKPGETVQFDVAFPENYGAPNLAGKTAQFEITVHSVNEQVLPEINEDFAKRLGVPDGSLETLRNDLKVNLENEVNARVKTDLRRNTIKALVEKIDVDLPDLMVKNEQNNLIRMAHQELAQRGLKEEDQPLPEDRFLKDAQNKVKAALLIEHVIRKENMQINPELVRERVEAFSKSYQQPDEVVKTIYGNQEQINTFANAAMEDQVIEWLSSQMKIKEESMPFSTILPDAE